MLVAMEAQEAHMQVVEVVECEDQESPRTLLRRRDRALGCSPLEQPKTSTWKEVQLQ